MRCADARRLLALGEDEEAYGHVAACPHCFAVLEQSDPMARLMVAARPLPAPVPQRLQATVLASWTPVPRPWSSWLAVAVMAALLMLAGSAFLLTHLSASVQAVVETASYLGLLASPIMSPISGLRSALLEVPAALAGYAVVTCGLCALLAFFYRRLDVSRGVLS